MYSSKINHKTAICLLFILFYSSCQDVGTLPHVSSRNYEWAVDTISYPESYQTVMRVIWGSSDKDIWVGGHNERGFGKLYHYDGLHWKDINLPHISSPEYNSILGFSKNNIYLAGSHLYIKNSKIRDSALIIKYNGSGWNEENVNGGETIFSISGDNNEIFASGYNGTLFRYNGIKWLQESFNIQIPPKYTDHYSTSILKTTKGEVFSNYRCINSLTTDDIIYFLKKENNNWIKLDSFFYNEQIKWGLRFWESPWGEIYSINPGVFKLNDNKWSRVLIDFNLYTVIGGTSYNNIFIGGKSLYHFNGNDWHEFSQFSNMYGLATAIFCYNNSVFIVFSDGSKSYIIKGFNKILN